MKNSDIMMAWYQKMMRSFFYSCICDFSATYVLIHFEHDIVRQFIVNLLCLSRFWICLWSIFNQILQRTAYKKSSFDIVKPVQRKYHGMCYWHALITRTHAINNSQPSASMCVNYCFRYGWKWLMGEQVITWLFGQFRISHTWKCNQHFSEN